VFADRRIHVDGVSARVAPGGFLLTARGRTRG
jgi:hypothetical protein